MTVNNAYQFIKDRLNKNNSGQNQGISQRQFVWAFNMAQYFWFDQRVKADNMDKVRQNELQQFIADICLTPSLNEKKMFYTINLPENYYYYEKAYAYAFKGECEHIIYGDPVEEGNVSKLLEDCFQEPSFEWQESFYTIGNDKLRFYHKDKFQIKEIILTYYRCPIEIDMEEIIDESPHSNINSELTKSSLYEVLNLTALIISGDIGDTNSFQAISNYLQQFN